MAPTQPLAYLNGRFVAANEAGLPLNDAGFVYGATVTDMVRTFRHQLFRLDAHLARFRQSCQLCQVPLQLTDVEISSTALELVAHNAKLIEANDDLALVMFATPGRIGFYLGDAADGPPTFGMHTFRLPVERFRRLHHEGARLIVPEMRAPGGVDPRAKQRSRMHWWIARQQVRGIDAGADALLLDANGYVTETASANIIAVRNGILLTPPAGTVLPGVSLDTVRGLCFQLGLEFREQRLTLDDCLSADELLLTCTTWCLAGVSRLNSHAIPWPGPVYGQLADAWSMEVGSAIV